MRYKGAHKPLPEIAKELNVDAVLVGSVRPSGGRVRITAQLIHAAEQKSLWADSYERDLRDILTLEGELARTIANEVKITLTPQERTLLESARPIDPEAHQLYLRGEHEANQRTVESLRKGIGYFEEAIAKNPNYALAQVGLASCYALLSSVYLSPRDAMPRAKAAALRALELEETLAQAHVWLGFVNLNFDWDWASAEREFRRALELSPSSADAHMYYADYFSAVGRPEDALREAKRALELDPVSPRVLLETQLAYFVARQYDQSIELGRKVLQRDPNFPTAYAYMGLAYAEKRQFPEAIAALETAVRLDGSSTNRGFLAHVHALAGNTGEARKSIGELAELSKRRYVCPFEPAVAYASLGDTDKAFEWLKQGIAKRADCMIWLRVDPCLARIRSDPRYAEVIHEVGLDEPRALPR
jgi:tetratricopeptide (TPR) repeat protein